MERWQDRVAVVTGASSGIGAAVAKDLVRAGVIVVGMARRVELIEALKEQLPEELHSRLHAVKCDVSEETSVAAAFDWVEEQLGGIDILVNNAGLLYPGQLLTMQLEKLHHVLQVNLLGVVYCSRRAFRSMQERGVAGHVVLINSLTGHHVIHPPGETLQQLNMYPLSKHGISALLEVMRQELNGLKTQIKVTVSTAATAAASFYPPALLILRHFCRASVPASLTRRFCPVATTHCPCCKRRTSRRASCTPWARRPMCRCIS